MIKLAHIINPYYADPASDAYRLQQITFKSIRQAREFAAGDHVELFTAQYEEDHAIIPDFFNKTPDLQNVVTGFQSFSHPHKYPLIKEILDRLFNATTADYLIFTNADIILMPQFYKSVIKIIEKGIDAFIINRRRIPNKNYSVEDLPLIISETGRSHPGFDCFIFKRNIYEKFVLGNICVGVPFSGITLAYNLFAFSDNFKLFDNLHLTLHIGMEVMPQRDKEYYNYNRREFKHIIEKLKPYLRAENMPYALLPFARRLIKWGLNPSLFTRIFFSMESQKGLDKIKALYQEVRFWLLKNI